MIDVVCFCGGVNGGGSVWGVVFCMNKWNVIVDMGGGEWCIEVNEICFIIFLIELCELR